jgi:TetR/AcrR family transcriptional regulator, regulator of autoinduction and epiphytic fitness
MSVNGQALNEQPVLHEPAERIGLRERQRLARNEAILEAAFSLIVEKGYDALTMETLAEQVGISRQTLYHHFANKEEVALRAIIELVEQGERAILAIDPDLPAVDRLDRVVRWMIDFRGSDLAAAFCRARPALVPIKAHPEFRQAFERRSRALAGIIEAAQAESAIRSDLPAQMLVQMLLGLVNGSYYEQIDLEESANDPLVEPERFVRAILSLFYDGVRPKESRVGSVT